LGVKTREAVSLQTRLIEAEATLDALRKQVSARVGSTAELNALTSRIADQASEIARLRVDLAEAQVHLRTDTAELRAGREQIDQDTIAQLESHLAERATLIAALESQLAEKSRAIVELRGHMAEVDSSLKNLERQLAFKAQEVETLQNNLNQAKDQAQARMSDLQAQMAAGSADDSSFTTAEYQALSVELEERDATIAMLEDQLKEATEQLASIDRQLADASKAVDAAISESSQVDSRDEVIASMVQELRTPMSSIMGYTELLLRESVGILGTGQRKFLQRVKANTERMGTLLDDMLRITAIESENLELSAERVDAVYVAEEAITGVSSQFREKGITLRLAIADGLPPILADRSAIHDVLGHLLSNSALASPVGGQVHLTVTTRRGSLHSPEGGDYTANCLYVSVRDSGAGIDEADQDRVFARKYRADNPLIEGLGDTGVTLSLAKALVDAHGGQIWFDSQKGQGTVFHVLIPIDARDGEESST
jgi:signal transduction histidine kinase